MTVIKRDGREVEFDKRKISNAIGLAMKRCNKNDKELCDKIATEIENLHKNYLSVEEIQDLVEKKLMNSAHKDVAKEYIIYRDKRNKERNKRSVLTKAIRDKIEAKNVKNQNANVDEHSFGGRVGEVSSVVMKDYALNYIVSDMAKANHLNNEIYIHDLSSYALGCHNCLTIPFDDILAKGFNTRQIDVRPAQSVNTAFQLVAVVFQLQSLQQFGRSFS